MQSKTIANMQLGGNIVNLKTVKKIHYRILVN